MAQLCKRLLLKVLQCYLGAGRNFVPAPGFSEAFKSRRLKFILILRFPLAVSRASPMIPKASGGVISSGRKIKIKEKAGNVWILAQ